MPFFVLNTNQSRDKIPETFPKELAQLVADCLERPVRTIMVQILAEQWLVRGEDGNQEPCGEATLRSIMNLGPEKNIEHSRKLSEKIAEIGIPKDNLFINFHQVKGYEVGHYGTTLGAKLGI